MKDLTEIRAEIDSIDNELILNSVEQKGGEYGEYARELYKKIMELSRDLQGEVISNKE